MQTHNVEIRRIARAEIKMLENYSKAHASRQKKGYK